MPSIHLTFDDGPDPRWTPVVLDLLAAYGAHASFFLVGRAACASPALVRRIHAAGHAIGNHTWSHRHPWLLSTKAARCEVRDGAKAIADILGRQPRLYRPPHGRRRACMEEAAAALGQRTVMWTRSAVDWGPLARPSAIARRLAHVRDGDILLMHDAACGINRPDRLLAVLPDCLRRLHAAAWNMVALDSQELAL